MSEIAGHHEAEHHGLGHVVPGKVLIGVWGVLVVLTVVTVAVTYVPLGRMNLWVALMIAAVKASLVLLYFMHLRYDSPFNAFIFVTAVVFLALFIVGAIGDSGAYQDTMQPPPGYSLPQ